MKRGQVFRNTSFLVVNTIIVGMLTIGVSLYMSGCADPTVIGNSDGSGNGGPSGGNPDTNPPGGGGPPTVCVPGTPGNPNPGLSGKIAYLYQNLPASNPQVVTDPTWHIPVGNFGIGNFFDFNLQDGTAVPKILSQSADAVATDLDLPTYNFSDGFDTVSGSKYKDTTGKVLVEYFGLHLQTNLTKKVTGSEKWVLAILSDDGSVVRIKDKSNSYRTYIDRDGLHWEGISCPQPGDFITFDSTHQSYPITIDYFQGPEYAIGLQLFWKKVSSTDTTTDWIDQFCCQKDGYYDSLGHCQQTGVVNGQTLTDGWLYTRPALGSTAPSTPTDNMKAFLARGWEPVPAANFVSDTATQTCH